MIKIYDKLLTPLCVLTKATSIQWTKRFYDVGSFELHLTPNDANLKYIKENHFISHNDNCGIILYLEQTPQDVKICGYDLKGLLKIRKCEGAKTGNAETVIKSFVSENLISATDSKRNIPNFANAPNQNRGDTVDWVCEDLKLDVEINKICLLSELGYDVKLINNEFVFDVIEGIDRTKNQSAVPPVMFCKQFKNISDFEYIKDASTAVNTVYVGTTEIYDSVYTGLERREGIEQSDGTEDEIRTKGKAILKEKAIKENISAETNHRLKYKTDWNLGDYVTLKVDVFGETLLLDKQITEVEEIYERGNISIKPTFGEVKESIIKRLLKG